MEYSQNGHNGLFSSAVYLGAAVVMWWISAFDDIYLFIRLNFYSWPQSLKGWKALSADWITQLVLIVLIQWIVIYPLYSGIHRLNNWALFLPVLFNAIKIHILKLFGVIHSHLSPLSYWAILVLVVNLRNMSANNVIAGDGVASFIIRSMVYLQSRKLQDCLRMSIQIFYTQPKAEIP